MEDMQDIQDNNSEINDISAGENRKQRKADDLNFYTMNAQHGNSGTQIPVNVSLSPNNDTPDFFQEGLPDSMPAKSTEGAGILESVRGRFLQNNEFAEMKSYANRKIEDNTPLDDYVPDDWSPSSDRAMLIGIDEKNLGYLMGATGPQDQIRRRNYILDQQEHDERMQNGSFMAQLAGGFSALGGAVASPSSLLFIGRAAKYATVSEDLLQNMPKIASGVAISSAAHEAVDQTTKIGGNLSDWAINTFADSVLGTAFMGAGIGTSHLMQAGKLFNAKGIIQMMDKGIEPRPVLNEKGEHVGWKATPMDSSVGAAQVDMAQAYLDGAMKKNSLYSIPYIGNSLGYAAGEAGKALAGKINPIIRSMNSRFTTMRGFMNNVADHGLETVGTEAGRPNPVSFETMLNQMRGTNTRLKVDYDGLYLQRNGVTYNPETFGSRTAANVQGQGQKYLDKDWVSKDQFGREVQDVIINDRSSQHAAVNEAANMLIDSMTPIYQDYLRLHGLSEEILPPKTAKGYLARVYHTAYMETNQDRWMEVIPNALREDDEEIASLMAPINNAKAAVKEAETAHQALIRSNASDDQLQASAKNLAALQRSHKAAKNALENNLRANPELHRHVEDMTAVSAKEAEQIKKLQKPIVEKKKQYDEQKQIVDKLSHEAFIASKSEGKVRTQEQAAESVQDTEQKKIQLAEEKDKLQQLKDARDEEEEKLQERMHNGEINKTLYTRVPDSNRYVLKDAKNRLKLRPVYESDFDRQTAAKAYYDTILNQTSEDNINNILGRMTGNATENPLKSRTLMIKDQVLYENNFLHPDPSINVMNYRQALGRKNAAKTMLNRLTVNGTFEELVDRLTREHDSMKGALSKPLSDLQQQREALGNDKAQIADLDRKITKAKAQYDKEVKKLGKAYKTAKTDMGLMIDKMMGRSRNSQLGRDFLRGANSFAAATKLGFVPLTMSTDLMATVFKHGLWPAVRDGLLPMLKTWGGILKTQDAQAVRETAAHAHIGMQHTNMAYSDRNWTGTSQTYEPVQGRLVTGMETLAHYSQNFSGTNYVENFLQRMTAQIIQSKVMKAMLDYSEGKLGKKDLTDLLRYGLDPKEYSSRFINEWKAAGADGNGFGGYQSRYWTWQDTEAATRMSSAIMRATKDTIIRKGMFDAPFAMDNPMIGSLFLFHGYVMASITRFLAPLMQSPDLRKMMGTMLMMAAGSTQNPLRRIASGQDPHQEDDHMFRNAIRDGGVFSILGDMYEEANFLTNGFLQESVTNERYRGRTEMGVFNGPIGGIANDMTRVIGMLASGQFNKTDMKRIAVNLPFVYSWQFRKLVNDSINSLNLPDTRAKARTQQSI